MDNKDLKFPTFDELMYLIQENLEEQANPDEYNNLERTWGLKDNVVSSYEDGEEYYVNCITVVHLPDGKLYQTRLTYFADKSYDKQNDWGDLEDIWMEVEPVEVKTIYYIPVIKVKDTNG